MENLKIIARRIRAKLRGSRGRKGFTLMEMLIVVAIIAVLVAIMIPTMTTSLERARVATDEANIRSAYAEAMASYLLDTDGERSGTSESFTLRTSGEADDIAGYHVVWTQGPVSVTVSGAGAAVISSSGTGSVTFGG